MSHLQGTDYVGSMVVLEDGLPRPVRVPPLPGPRRARQRRLRGHGGGPHPPAHRPPRGTGQTRGDDADGGSARARRFAYPPQLLLLDGGKGQLGVGVRVLERLGLADEIPVAALAKTLRGGLRARAGPTRCPSRGGPRRCSCCSGCATRRTASPSRTTASSGARRMTRSALEGVPGLGPARRARLLRRVRQPAGAAGRLARGAPGPALAPRRRGRGGARPPARRAPPAGPGPVTPWPRSAPGWRRPGPELPGDGPAGPGTREVTGTRERLPPDHRHVGGGTLHGGGRPRGRRAGT